MKNLETLLADFGGDALSPAWTTFDWETFSKSKQLWPYQQSALQNATKALWKFYGSSPNAARKHAFYQWYNDNDIALDPLAVGKKSAMVDLLAPFYPVV